MKRYLIFICLFTLLISQDNRSTLFSTGNPPELGVGWDVRCSEFSEGEQLGDINQDNSLDVLDVVALIGFIVGNAVPTEEEFTLSDINLDGTVDILDIVLMVSLILDGATTSNTCLSGLSASVRFFSPNEYTFEAFSVIFQTEDLEGEGLFEINLHDDLNDSPGDVLGSWELSLDENMAREYYVFTGDTDCIVLSPMTTYWLSVHPINNQDEALWLFSEGDFTYSTSQDMGNSWSESYFDQVGCTKIFAEQIYDSPDPNPGEEVVYDWSLEDINSNSEYFTQSIGPSTFINQDFVSVYYFGKAG
tara:strand:+ start:64 stop:975 length:912 start_codon:yes stop_codon:yes gene_type:complete